jgi:signal transduction histidine kinase
VLVTSWTNWVEGLARALMVGAPIAVGLYARRRVPFARFGGLLVGIGFISFVATLSNSPDAVVYSVGRVGAWLAELAVVYVILAFPTGRLGDRIDRVLVAVVAADVFLLYLPTALLVDSYPLPTLYTACTQGCPGNAFDVVGQQPAFVEDFIYPLRELVLISATIAVVVRLGSRLRSATPVMRRTLEPVLFAAIFRVGALGAGILARRLELSDRAVQVAGWVVSFAIPVLAFAFLAGLVRWRLFVAGAMQSLATQLPGHAEPEQLRAALADAFDDPSIEIAYWVDDGWVDAEGRPFVPPSVASGRWLTVVEDDGARVAAIVHDAGLRNDDAFVATATSYVLMTLDNQRLTAQARGLLHEVSESRARIQATADEERRRIERDLHDGAQQRAAALRSPLPATVLVTGVGRYSREIETTAYFCCLEALQNAAKHAHGASAAVIELSDDGVVRVEVHDDGAGFDVATVDHGSGLVNMRDRLSAVGGELAIESSLGRGTRIAITIPLDVS